MTHRYFILVLLFLCLSSLAQKKLKGSFSGDTLFAGYYQSLYNDTIFINYTLTFENDSLFQFQFDWPKTNYYYEGRYKILSGKLFLHFYDGDEPNTLDIIEGQTWEYEIKVLKPKKLVLKRRNKNFRLKKTKEPKVKF